MVIEASSASMLKQDSSTKIKLSLAESIVVWEIEEQRNMQRAKLKRELSTTASKNNTNLISNI